MVSSSPSTRRRKPKLQGSETSMDLRECIGSGFRDSDSRRRLTSEPGQVYRPQNWSAAALDDCQSDIWTELEAATTLRILVEQDASA